MKKFSYGNFPFVTKRINHHGSRSEMVRFELLDGSNHKACEQGLARWDKWLKTARELLPAKAPGETEVLYHDHFYDTRSYLAAPTALSRTYTIFASSQGGDMEGLITMTRLSDRSTYISYIGIAPWNLHTKLSRPKFTGLPMDMMRLSLLFALHNAADLPDGSRIFRGDFCSDRGILFAKRFFGITETFEESEMIKLAITKLGVRAFLEGDRNAFAGNYSAVPNPAY